MQPDSDKPQLTGLLSNDVLHRLERTRINASRRFTNRTSGEHLSGKGGRSIEFSDYRDYVAGDDFRFVDWNAFARLHRPYLKLFHQEEEMNVVLLVDASSSMVFQRAVAGHVVISSTSLLPFVMRRMRPTAVRSVALNFPPRAPDDQSL